MIIRNERSSDGEAIFEVTKAAFVTCPYSHQTEQYIVNGLRRAGALAVSLVAEEGGQVVGHVAFSPITVSDGSEGWYGVGPLSVLPSHQRQSIGSALMREGIVTLKRMGGQGCALVGEPAYYQRFGFRHYPELVLEGVPQEYFQALPFRDAVPRGKVTFHEAFMAKE